MRRIVWLLAGAAVGVAATALFSTECGARVRRRVKDVLVDSGLMADDGTEEFVEMFARELDED